MEQPQREWERYGRAIVAAMAETLEELEESARPLALEVADYWFAVGLTAGLQRPEQARLLLELIEQEEANRTELEHDAVALLQEVLP